MSRHHDIQQWEDVVIRKPSSKNLHLPLVWQLLKQRGQVVSMQRQQGGGASRRVAESEDVPDISRINPEVASRIQKARQEKNLTRAQLAQRLNVKESVLGEIESRRAVMTPQINSLLGKMERMLQVKLRGDLSKPFEVKGKKK
ncbi:hypothetical protein P9112_013418 [Eukaryota sp. TZLM1-RC]